MNQRGIGLVVYLIAAAVVVASVLGWGQYRYSQGVDSERVRNLNAALDQEVKMSDLRRKHADELEAMARRLSANSQAANQRIRDLMQTNKALLDWWRTVIDSDAAAFAWLLPAGNNEVRGGSDAAVSNPDTGKAGETH